MHLVVYELTGAGAVVHTHSSVATALGTVREELPAIHYAITAFGGPVRVAPYALFGTTELAGGLRGALAGRTAALLANHGAVVSGRTLDEAYDHAVLLEWLCSVYWHASALGSPRVLGEGELDAVRAQMARLEYGEPR
jgi:L-fuculose-phosphate aldolase